MRTFETFTLCRVLAMVYFKKFIGEVWTIAQIRPDGVTRLQVMGLLPEP